MNRVKALKCTRAWLLPWLLLPLLVLASPDLVLRDVDGRAHNVSEFIGRGQWTVVALWSVDCAVCRRDMPAVTSFHDRHRARDAIVLGVSVDGFAQRARVRGFIEENALNFPNLIAEYFDVGKLGAGPLRGTPTYLFFSPRGILVARRLGSMPLSEMEKIIGAGKGAPSETI